MTEEVSNCDIPIPGDEIVMRARAWLGTPYQHQASCRGAGADCLGLLRGLWREFFEDEPEPIPPYTADWSEVSRRETLLTAIARHLLPVQAFQARSGDVLVLRMAERGAAKHVGILACSSSGHRTIIHAYSGHGVVESPLTPVWSRRIAGIFRFPDRRS